MEKLRPFLTPRRGARTGAGLLALAFVLAGCIRPLYGPTASGAPLRDVLAAVEVAQLGPPPGLERLAHNLRSDLVFDLDGSGRPAPKRYRLDLGIRERLDTPIVDTISGRAAAATLVATADFTLVRTADGVVVTKGTATASASYDRTQQRFASIRAARDAELRVAKLLSDQIRTRLAATLATSP